MVQSRGFSEFNIFKERRVVIGEIHNEGDKAYEYIGKSVRSLIFNYSKAIPFLTLTDEEYSFLLSLSKKEEYRDDFLKAGEWIDHRMIPHVEKGSPLEGGFPLYIYGYYQVKSEDDTVLTLYKNNGITDLTETEFIINTSLNTLINEPDTYLIPFFQEVVGYKTYRASFNVSPGDAIIFLDDRTLGVGSLRNILVTPGYHRLSVMREGYRDFSDLINIYRDGFFMEIELSGKEMMESINTGASQGVVSVYIDGNYAGDTPAVLFPSEDYRTMTFVKKGYNNETFFRDDITPGKDKLFVDLESPERMVELKVKAESHREKSKLLARAGYVGLGLSIILKMEKTLNSQRVDLYRGVNDDRYESSLRSESLFTFLTATSSVTTGSIFLFSFIELLNYFNISSDH